MSDGKQPIGGLPWTACVRLRLYHQVVRNDLAEARADPKRSTRLNELLKDNDPPLNQEDLLAMVLMFSFVVFEVLDLYGITWTADEQEAYLHLWDVVGAYLGVGSTDAKAALAETFVVPSNWHGLRPATIEQSHRLLDQLRARQWIDPKTGGENVDAMSWSSLRVGRVLVRALLDELEKGMPPLLKPLPIAVMRAINPGRVRTRLNLGGNGVVLQSLNLLPKREERVAPFTSIRSPNRLAGRVLRTLANEVTTRASVYLGQEFDLTPPGSPDWHQLV
jgi:hypothetical protein